MAKTNRRKVSKEKQRKANWMWIEQFFLKLDSLEKQISDLSVEIIELRKRVEALENAEK